MTCQTVTIAIVDAPDTHHGRLMQGYARLGDFAPSIQWIQPSLQLPHDLAALDGVAAVAIPLGVIGATPRDRFTRWLMQAIQGLMARRIPVFVAAGHRGQNLLANAGIGVSIDAVPGSTSTSEACVRAAIREACRASYPSHRHTPYPNGRGLG
jgi:hypothetical protein